MDHAIEELLQSQYDELVEIVAGFSNEHDVDDQSETS